jgi:hypothetical protein
LSLLGDTAGMIKKKGKQRVKPMLAFARELIAYMSARKKWWLLPLLIVVLIFGGIIVLAQGSAVAPFIYTVF